MLTAWTAVVEAAVADAPVVIPLPVAGGGVVAAAGWWRR
jgi:hypothetical protein